MVAEVSDMTKTGATIMLVAALLAIILNIMAMSTSILNSGQNALQSGTDAIAGTQYAPYDNKKVTGAMVITALNTFQGQDVAICVQTYAIRKTLGKDAYINYGGLLAKNMENGSSPTKCTNNTVVNTIVGEAYQIAVGTTSGDMRQQSGQPWYEGLLFVQNGIVSVNYNIKGLSAAGNPQQVLAGSRYSSTLIKDVTGNIIGIVFTQVS